ncbi:hypothetical protein CU097_002094 [Rhizopus azygosporus]|uniref:Uncharacterized protein n=1 Tax=Rhizopus azygosporus TaxID=86630 RepID=A0A367JU91_RHIAZ|nr:hypothetical protein CU097_002094 [Rhizopus azygosporus]
MFAAQRNVLHRSILYKQSLFCRKPLNRFFITKALTASHNNRRHPVWNGSVRQHGTHGHHHHDADLLTSLKSSSKRGTRITIIGLASNVGLTVSKGVAGWMMNSASLLAESLHSFSDLLSDFVTLYTYRMSRKPPDSLYPYGYGKFETVGSVAVSSLLLAGAVGIGWHSFDLLLATLQVSTPSVTTAVAAAGSTVAESHSFLGHSHGHGGVLDPNAAWFALASVIIKEWLYRVTIKVGQEERSDVLIANAWHHRSDAYSSAVALVAIVGSYAGMPVLDPLGGIAVSAMLVQSSVGLIRSSMSELMDRGISANEMQSVIAAVSKVKATESDLVNFHSIRGRKQGRYNHIDLVLQLNPAMSMQKAHQLEQLVKDTVKNDCRNIQDILIYLEDASSTKAQLTTSDNSCHEDNHHHHHH